MNLIAKIQRAFKKKQYSKSYKKEISSQYSLTMFSDQAIEKLLSKYKFNTVLDIGCGDGQHSEVFINAGKKVTAIDYGESIYFKNNKQKLNIIIDDFNKHCFHEQFDCIWCSHVLEHQLNINFFLKKMHSILKEGGILAISVPPLKHDIVGGHVSIWNAGLLLYNLVLAGFDCKNANIKSYGYNISIILRKRTINVLDIIEFDAGDILKIRPYLPKELNYFTTPYDTPFDGNIEEINWD
jgi:SAM-dependent methyltransferase